MLPNLVLLSFKCWIFKESESTSCSQSLIDIMQGRLHRGETVPTLRIRDARGFDNDTADRLRAMLGPQAADWDGKDCDAEDDESNDAHW